ncbi:MAG: hypothetical protein LBV09_04455 [Deferribacteraceae bacterium]|jgi:PTS system mannose-specific IIC component|nr:hypothetical protein [Deferribacteraceae bacterium]
MSLFWIPLAGLFAMDRRAAFNFMLSRPFVVSAIMGLIGDNLIWCLIGGIFFEIIGLMDLPVGTKISRDDTFGAFAYSLTVITCYIHSYDAALVALVLSFIMMLPSTLTVRYRRHVNAQLFTIFQERSWLERHEGLLMFIGELLSFIRGMFIYSIGALIVIFLYALIYRHVISDIPTSALILLCCLFGGYFSGFFQARGWSKMLFLFAGGAAQWLIS